MSDGSLLFINPSLVPQRIKYLGERQRQWCVFPITNSPLPECCPPSQSAQASLVLGGGSYAFTSRGSTTLGTIHLWFSYGLGLVVGVRCAAIFGAVFVTMPIAIVNSAVKWSHVMELITNGVADVAVSR